jgi:hypothetical protein
MARGDNNAQSGANAALGENQQLYNNGQSLYGALAPELETQMAHPAGIDPTTMAKMNTSSMETAGGSQAGAVGQGALKAARTRNAGGSDAAIAESSRAAGQNLGSANLKTELANESLKEKERESATSGMEGLYGTNTGASVQDLGQVANNVNANANAANQSWDWAKYILDPALEADSKIAAAGMG